MQFYIPITVIRLYWSGEKDFISMTQKEKNIWTLRQESECRPWDMGTVNTMLP